jgi:3-hydroxyacyl-CoA dehydrogenase
MENKMSLATSEQQQVMNPGLHERPHVRVDPQVKVLDATPCHTEEPANDDTRRIARVGILGANAISIGIAIRFLRADIPVTVFDRRDALDRGLALLRASAELPADKRDRCLALFSATARFHHLKDCDLLIELMPVEADTRKTFFQWLDEIGKPSAIMVANVHGLALNELARVTRRPSDVLGLQASPPGDILEKLRLARGRETSSEAFMTVTRQLAVIGQPMSQETSKKSSG